MSNGDFIEGEEKAGWKTGFQEIPNPLTTHTSVKDIQKLKLKLNFKFANAGPSYTRETQGKKKLDFWNAKL